MNRFVLMSKERRRSIKGVVVVGKREEVKRLGEFFGCRRIDAEYWCLDCVWKIFVLV